MTKTLPKGHVSCLSNAFRYTPALNTNVASTFARIKRELRLRDAPRVGIPTTTERHAVARPLPVETIESARRLLRSGGLRLAPHLVHSL
jgi:hypothetical protein